MIDKRAVLELRPELAISMPMPKMSLLPGQVDRFQERAQDLINMCGPGGLQGGFKTLAVMGMSPAFSGMDYVDRWTYSDLWKKAGARLGVVRDGMIVWEWDSL